MESRFGSNFSQVRLYNDSLTSWGLDEIGARGAATRGEAVHLAADTRLESLDGKKVLAHELAHIEQQRRGMTGQVTPGASESLEGAADRAARQSSHQATLGTTVTGAAPAVQFQFRQPDAVGRPEVIQELTRFLRQVHRAQGGRTLQITQQVRSALQMLAMARTPGGQAPNPGTVLSMDLFLSQPALVPRDPARLARRAAGMLPSPFSRRALQRLRRMTLTEAESQTPLERVGALIAGSAAGSPEAQEEAEAARVASGEAEPGPRISRPPVRDPGVPDAIERSDELASIDRAIRGEEEPTEIGPGSVDVLRIGRILGGLGAAIEGPQRPGPEARSYASVERIITAISREALIPAGVRGTGRAGSFADAQLMARDFARRLDLAQQRNQGTVQIRLGANYRGVRDRGAVLGEVERIVRRIAAAMPHRASNVDRVLVYIGNRVARTVALR